MYSLDSHSLGKYKNLQQYIENVLFSVNRQIKTSIIVFGYIQLSHPIFWWTSVLHG